jgi:hypothetical protein
MSRKTYKGKQCVYCVQAPADSADHAIARNFFLVNRRANLPQVPACKRCNGEKAELENYLMVVLSFGGRHTDAAVNLHTMVPKRLLKNKKLHEELARGFAESGGTAIPFDHVRLDRFFAMTARALAWYHWQVLLGAGYSAIASTFSDSGTTFFDHLLNKTPIRVVGNLGSNTFSYQGAQATDCPEMTVWRFSMYGGVQFLGDPKVPGPTSLAGAVTGRDAFIKNLQTKTAA